MDGEATGIVSDTGKKDGLSYKYQRLREQLRQAVGNGTLNGKLPGERTLARQFQVNAKTLSKALTDLAAEGLLDRSIGRGTYVKGTLPTETDIKTGRWLIVCENGQAESEMVRSIFAANPSASVLHDVSEIRPSFLRQFDAVLDLGLNTPDQFLRDLIVRGVRPIAVNREPDGQLIDTITPDRAFGAALLARDLILSGHGHLAVIEPIPNGPVGRAVQQAVARYNSDAVITICTTETAQSAIKAGASGIICDSVTSARAIQAMLSSAGIRFPKDVSLAAVGTCGGSHPCSGQYLDCETLTRAIVDLLSENATQRPTVLWLATKWVDQGTTAVVKRLAGEAA